MALRRVGIVAGSSIGSFVLRTSLIVALVAVPAARAETNVPPENQVAIYKDQSNDRMGVRDVASGRIVLPPEYESIRSLTEAGQSGGRGLFVVGNKAESDRVRYGVLDLERNYVVPMEFDEVGAMRDGVIAVRKANKWGFVDRNGKRLVEPEYDEVWSHGRNCAVVKVREKYGAVDMSGKTIMEPIYDGIAAAYPSTGGKYCFEKLVVMLDGKRRFVDLEKAAGAGGGKASAEPGKGAISKYREGGKYGFRSPSGGTLVEAVFDDAWDFSNGYARVKKDGKWGFVDSTGKTAVEPAYDYVWDYDGRRAKVRLQDGSIHYIDMTGKMSD